MNRKLLEAISAVVRPVAVRVANIVQRAVVTLVDDSTKLQELQVKAAAEAIRSKAERFQQYGFTSVPLPGAEAVVLFVGGYGDHPLVIAVDDRRYRPKGLEGGEVAVYTDEGHSIIIKRGGHVVINGATVKLGDDTAAEALALATKVDARLSQIADAVNGHVHTGVTVGAGATAPAVVVGALPSVASARVTAKD